MDKLLKKVAPQVGGDMDTLAVSLVLSKQSPLPLFDRLQICKQRLLLVVMRPAFLLCLSTGLGE